MQAAALDSMQRGSLGDGVKILGAILIGVTVLAVSAFFIVRFLEDRVTDELVSQVSLLEIPLTGCCWTRSFAANSTCA